ncbi:hypothetical protein HMPREF0240_03096 [Clostridium sp. D5]|nr:hypothetical protein HMPREF0240_03096 [Clostridium sp. D5]
MHYNDINKDTPATETIKNDPRYGGRSYVNGGYSVIKLNIVNMNQFLNLVNNSTGPVHLLSPDGRKELLNHQYTLQRELRQKHLEAKRSLRLTLELPNPKDYMTIVLFSIGDC